MIRSKVKLEQIIDIENCKRAILNASKGKRKRPNVAKYVNDLDHSAELLKQYIQNICMVLHDGERTTINEGTRKKTRILCKAPFFPDHCVHWAVMQLVAPTLTKSYYAYSCASISGRGTHYAKRVVERSIKDTRGTKYCGQFDVKSFYASVDKEILINLLGKKFKDKRIVALLSKIIRSYNGDGLPLGYYPSALLANFYLTEADRYIKETLQIRHYCRYMDDMIMYDGNKRKLHKARATLTVFLGKTRKLKLKENWQVYKMPYLRGKPPKDYKERRRATDFVGFKFYRYKTTIRKTIFLNILRCLRKLAKGKYTATLARKFFSYLGYIKHTMSENVKRKYINGKINIKKLKEIIRDESRNYNAVGASA